MDDIDAVSTVSSVLSKGSEPFLQIIASVIFGRSHVGNRSLQVSIYGK